MRLGVIGGRLQGTEAAYLGALAGYEVVLVDRTYTVPASGLAHESHVFDVTIAERRTHELLASCDAVIPALEDGETLRWLDERLRAWGIPFLFDADSYEITCSKLRSDELFAELDLPRPVPWPDCALPAVVKPSGSSGSEGVTVARSTAEVAAARTALEVRGHEVVVQEYVEGPSLSVEVVAAGGRALTLPATSLEFDLGHDCKRVIAPAESDPHTVAALHAAGSRLAEALGLTGIMDVEAMVGGGEPKIIEIDARLPSQTPSAVYHATDLNMVAVLVDTVMGGQPPIADARVLRATVYQHLAVADGLLEIVGEHALAHARPLTRIPGFFGAHDALTDYAPGETGWVATIITRGTDPAGAREAGERVLARLASELGLRRAAASR